MAVKIHLLDVGTQKYGDSVLCEFGAITVLIDGAHSGDTEIIRDQINELLDQPKISLLIVTHAHADHIGCIPKLVADGSIAVEWALVPDPDLGFGKTPGDAPPDSETDAQRRTRILAAALREEDRTDVPDADLREFLDSLDNQEADYRKFIQDLRDGGANVVLFGTKSINQIQQQFNAIGFRVVGPNQAQIDAAAERIKNAVDFTDAIAADVLSRDAQADLVDTYRALMSAVTDSGRDRPGDAINMMSLVTRFTVGGRKFLFGGDMEFAHPKPSIDAIEQGVAAMRQAIRDDAPYDFYKLCHHGSWNGFDGDILADLGATKYLGICTGTNSPSHPAAKTLTLLRQNDDDLKWARTDRNGRSTFSFGTNVRVTKERGKLNNSEPNKQDVFGGEEQPLIPAPPPPVTVTTAPVLSGGDPVEVIARVRSGTRVTITIDVDGDGRSDVSTSRGEAVRNTGVPRIEIGRDVERLLFVTSAAALADNIGPAAGLALNALRKRGAIVLDTLPAGLQHASQAAPVVQEELRRSQAKGVVILGGYDVVPPQSLDCLPPELRRRTARNADPDNFIVWSDDTYGDREGDHFPEVPVSRIPDGRSAALVAASLAAPPRGVGSAAVRNVARPFAEVVYSRLPGGRPILRSEATIFSAPRYLLDSANVYVMLHGDYTDGSRFWGEDTEDDLEALNISNLPAVSGAVVFTGCCWGALTVDKPAGRLVPGQTLGVKTPDSSIALAFLRRGARAYVGCTGAHYSPLEDPYDFFGGPMHEAFWGEIVRGVEPAQALFNAKATYMRGLPHGQTSVAGRSIEYKIARQFTCLGLGW